MPVPHNSPLGRNEGPANWVAGFNEPGYLPVAEPAFFTDHDDAKRYLCNILEEHADEELSTENAEELSALAADLNLESGEWSATIHGLAYWLEKVEYKGG